MNIDRILQRLLGRATCTLTPGARLTRSAKIRNIRGVTGAIRIGMNSVISGELLLFRHGGSIDICYFFYVF